MKNAEVKMETERKDRTMDTIVKPLDLNPETVQVLEEIRKGN